MRGVNEGHFIKLQAHNVRETVTKTIFSIPLGHIIVQKSLRIIAYFVHSVPASTDPSGVDQR